MDKLNKSYNPSEFEESIYKNWLDKNYFSPKLDKRLDPFSMIMPPPNITGQLHMGHALDNAIQDTLVRFKRMQGFSTLWIPGTDHASIATEVKIVDKIYKEEGLKKTDITREDFLERAWKWKEEYGRNIVNQMYSLGLSCDWTREAFTMDKQRSEAVKKVFCKMYKKGYIYRGNRIINWCPCCKTAISDAEVEYIEKPSSLWHIRYPYEDGSGEVIIATTRPETLIGDTAVAVHPNDLRYKNQIGKNLILPLFNRKIPLIADSYVEKDFGTGAVKITPAHDPNDFEVGLRHNLEVIKVIDDSGYILEIGNKYHKMNVLTAREAIVKDLEENGYLVKIEPYNHNVGQCYRCHSTIESTVSKQWFMKMKPLAKPAIEAVKQKKIKFIPERFTKIYYNWMENIKDWCLSRQLWWGHRIPAYYCQDCGYLEVSENEVKKCRKCNSIKIKQDEDVLDTWFSSALWPFSTLGYPKKTQDLSYFYPTSVLVTGYDIIFFWVARMIFSSIENMGDIPFSTVVLHGIVRDSQGRKMSKSLGNGIDPLPVIKKYGADSLRYALLTGIAPGNDTRYSEEKIESSAAFMNKIWNVCKLLSMSKEQIRIQEIGTFRLNPADKWILSKLNEMIRNVTNNMDKFEIGLALQNLYSFIWTEYCDWYLELIKKNLKSEDKRIKEKQVSIFYYTFNIILKLLHPFIPFVTEQLYIHLNGKNKTLVTSQWPKYNKAHVYKKDREDFEKIIELIKSIRNLRYEIKIPNSKTIKLIFVIKNDEERIIKKNIEYISSITNCSNYEIIQNKQSIKEECVSTVTKLCEVLIPVEDLIDKEKELDRLNKEKDSILFEINRSKKMLSNKGFVDKAPKKIIEQEEEKLKINNDKFLKIEEQIKAILKK